MPSEIRKDLLDRFWSIYEIEGTLQALSWLETLKYFEDYCQDDISGITSRMATASIHDPR